MNAGKIVGCLIVAALMGIMYYISVTGATVSQGGGPTLVFFLAFGFVAIAES